MSTSIAASGDSTTHLNGNGNAKGIGASGSAETWTMNEPLPTADPEVFDIMRKEKDRQTRGLEMIASENFTSLAVLESMSSCLHNKYSEGQPGVRYYGGNEFIDELEWLTQRRSLAAFGLSEEKWGVNVQPYSGSPANFAVYTALLEPHGRIMGLDLPDGGHLTHGFFTAKKKISASAIFFESMPYKVDPVSGLIDYDELERTASLFKPKMIIAGMSCYSRHLDYARFRKIADANGALLMADMAHVSGLVAAGLVRPNPFDFCDVVTSTCHKTLKGPRAGIIFYRRGVRSVSKDGKETPYDLEEKINLAVFPALQGGPHNHVIAGIAVAMKHAQTDEFKSYQLQTVRNAQALSAGLSAHGYQIATGGTDNHIVLVDLRQAKLSGAKAERILEDISISCNKNTVPGDKSALNPSGIRLGTPPLTTRGLNEGDMDKVVGFIHRALTLAQEVQSVSGPKLVDWKRRLETDAETKARVQELKEEVEEFACKFRMPGHANF